ncbi:MAG: cupin domain-containing protein [Actinobacteria bacterium]|nr:cupin domain-containing protein [Actinomycetota bacterium]
MLQPIARGRGDRHKYAWGVIEWLANAVLTPGAGMTFGHVVLDPGAHNPRHLHPNCHELLYVVAGSLEHELGDQVVRLPSGSLLHIPQGVVHQARNLLDTPCEILVAYSSERRETVFVDVDPKD